MANRTLTSVLLNSSGNIILVLAGIVSFPAFTRLLSADEYGLMSLLNSTIFISVAFGKCGIQQAMVRAWSPDEIANRRVYSTALQGVLMMSTLVALITYGGLYWYLEPMLDDNRFLFVLVAGIIILESVKSIVANKELVLERSFRFNLARILHKYLYILIGIGLLMTMHTGVIAVMYGFYLASTIVFIWLYTTDKALKYQATLYDYALLKNFIGFGAPLLLVELIDQALSFGDKYLITYFNGMAAVGMYSAAYNFVFSIQGVILSTVSLTMAPLVMRRYNEAGEIGVDRFLNDAMRWYLGFGSAVAMGLYLVGSDVFLLLTSERYAAALPLLTPVIAGYFLFGIYILAAYRLFIQKRTKQSSRFMAIAAVVSVATNLLLLPKIGVMGAAIATLAAYAVLALLGCWLLWRFHFIWKILAMSVYLAPTAVMYLVLDLTPNTTDWLSVGYRVGVGAVSWALMASLVFKEARMAWSRGLDRILGKL